MLAVRPTLVVQLDSALDRLIFTIAWTVLCMWYGEGNSCVTPLVQ